MENSTGEGRVKVAEAYYLPSFIAVGYIEESSQELVECPLGLLAVEAVLVGFVTPSRQELFGFFLRGALSRSSNLATAAVGEYGPPVAGVGPPVEAVLVSGHSSLSLFS